MHKPSRTSRWFQSPVVFTVIAVVTLGTTILSTGLGRRGKGRFEEARRQMNAECMEVGGSSARVAPGLSSTSPCVLGAYGPPAVPELKLGQQDLAAAQAAVRDGERGRAASALVRVLERADRIDRNNTLIASLVAGKLLDGVSDQVDARPSLLDEPALAAAIRRTAFTSSRRPLESERLHALARLSMVPAQVHLRSAGLVESTTTDAMTQVDRTLREMQSALLQHDTKACTTAAEHTHGLAAWVTLGPDICRIASPIVQSHDRLESLRARAAVRGPRLHVTAARMP